MRKQNNHKQRKNFKHPAKNVRRVAKPKYAPKIVKKAIARTRQDIADWQRALRLTDLEENPKWDKLQRLYKEVSNDALFTSQYNNRKLKTLSRKPILVNANGEPDEEQTLLLQTAKWANEINKYIIDSRFYGYSLIEFSFDKQGLKVTQIPREHIDPVNGVVYPDLSGTDTIMYRNTPEYNVWLLEFKDEEYGLLNKVVPHILFKRFSQSAWSELAEIYGIPPRVLKTNTQDPKALSRGEEMMTDMGAAAWFIIDETENFEFAQGVATNGDVYANLINLCNNEISMVISGAIIGQDTKHGNRSKEESSMNMLDTLIANDLLYIKQEWNLKIIPALQKIGVLKGDLRFTFEQTEDIEQLWKMTTEALPYFNIDTEWVKNKFGIEVTEVKNKTDKTDLNADIDFFD